MMSALPVRELLGGQFLALCMSGTGVFSTLLVQNNRSFPLLQAITAYCTVVMVFAPAYLFSLVYLSRAKRRRAQQQQQQQQGDQQQSVYNTIEGNALLREEKSDRPAVLNWVASIAAMVREVRYPHFSPFDRPWRYAVIGLIDLEANYAVVKAYQYTNMTSVQLLDCFSILFVIVLSWIVLGRRPRLPHVVGAVIAIAGLSLLIASDADGQSRTAEAPNALLGDALCIVSSALYAISNVLGEKILCAGSNTVSRDSEVSDVPPAAAVSETTFTAVVGSSPTKSSSTGSFPPPQQEEAPVWLTTCEYLTLMPLCGAVFGTIQFLILECADVQSSGPWTSVDWGYQMGFGLVMLAVYGGMPLLFVVAGATFANVSLLTSDVYSILWNVTIFKIYPKWLFAVAYAIIATGIVTYATEGKLWHWCRERWARLTSRSYAVREADDVDSTAG